MTFVHVNNFLYDYYNNNNNNYLFRFKDKEEQKPTDHIQMGAKDGIAWLSISDVRDSDAGCYQCTLSNDDGETSSTALLNVDCKTSFYLTLSTHTHRQAHTHR